LTMFAILPNFINVVVRNVDNKCKRRYHSDYVRLGDMAMLVIEKRDRYDAFLPPTPVTQEMRQQVEALAKRERVSKAQVMRSALAFFLDQDVRYSDIDGQHILQQSPQK
jgi:hypothetical protein